ncbi:ATP-binding protein [Endothiovibrio diazotrophicus]
MFHRPQLATLTDRLRQPRRFLQILAGPRQVGKTTLARQAMARFGKQAHYASADLPAAPEPGWVEQQWRIARMLAGQGPALLVLDEVQKVPRWSESVKRLWDEDGFDDRPLQVVLPGSSQFLMQQGLTESLAGRFELIRLPHWSYTEMNEAFGWDVERYVYFGGYPGAAALVEDEFRWRSYVLDSIIEPTLSRDVLQLARIDKPALLRRLFVLGCAYSGQILSYQKMVGLLQDVGNTTTLAHYLTLLGSAWMLTGLDKFAGERVRSRAASPKLLALDTALLSSQLATGFDAARGDRELWGRLVESAVGAHLFNSAPPGMEISYWRERNLEVDFVLRQGEKVVGIEMKSGRNKGALIGLERFTADFKARPGLVVGTEGIPLEVFLGVGAEEWLEGA